MTTTRVVDTAGLVNAIAVCVAGDAIVLADGLYVLDRVLWSRAVGGSTSPILVRAENHGRAVIETNGNEEAFRIVHPFWHLLGLHVRTSKGSTYAVKIEGNAHHAKIEGCTFEIQPGSEAAIKGAGGSTPPYPDAATIENNLIYMTAPTTYGLAEGIDFVACNKWVVRGNRVRGFRTSKGTVAFGIMGKGGSASALIENNVVTGNFIGISLGGGGTAPEWMRDGVTIYEARAGIIRNNVIADSDDVSIYLYAANATKVHGNYLIGSFKKLGAGGSSIDVRMPMSTADIALNVLDKPILNRDGGTHGARSNIYLPSPALGTVYFAPK